MNYPPLSTLTDTGHEPVNQPLLRRGRALQLVDIENLNQGPSDDYTNAARQWLEVVGSNPGDLAVVGVDVMGAFAACDSLPTAGLVVGRGPSGADRALIARGHAGLSTGRFDTLIIGSGDGEFTDLAAAARASGLYVAVVSHPRSLSRRLSRAANRIVLLDPPTPDTAEEGDCA